MKHQRISRELELGLKKHTIDGVEKISENLGVHPISVLVASYLREQPEMTVQELLERIRSDLDSDSNSSSDA
ncbi:MULTISPECIES: hypothetical protein [Pseudomonas]|uniref:Uncharacterized protein n=1 Tax=Pseudomonas neustonica TaxID=2487346 RepID=A0ABX9XD75_9PSED|nr:MULTISPECIES: hypothetical protein [Pseudomonas]MAB24982.1 hypothetical protein [Pseudomonadales bacterium]MBA6421260.1 hypothetical protein [Pseudomonas sp. 5Ae-yellow]ROZ80135.1 hypothetical protein EF099_18690 [Pseudomonas sp. SSM44]ROZ80977.1 hypothetical protein EF096_18495 [Pseudomonas neustonica]|tara:strand:+ start:399 stop:614 length:216 start_codon:yes stop_codon:yes gene_type:complete